MKPSFLQYFLTLEPKITAKALHVWPHADGEKDNVAWRLGSADGFSVLIPWGWDAPLTVSLYSSYYWKNIGSRIRIIAKFFFIWYSGTSIREADTHADTCRFKYWNHVMNRLFWNEFTLGQGLKLWSILMPVRGSQGQSFSCPKWSWWSRSVHTRSM